MIHSEVYCFFSGLLKWNNSKKTSYVVENKKLPGKVRVLNLRNKRKNVSERVIIRYYGWEKITKEKGKIIIKIIPIDEIIGQSLGNMSLEEKLCILEVWEKPER